MLKVTNTYVPRLVESVRVNIGMPVLRTDGRTDGRSVYGHVFIKFSRMGSLPHFLIHGAPQARLARQSSAIMGEYL